VEAQADIPRSQTFVSGFARGLQVIEAFGEAAEPLSLPEVAVRAGVDRAVARRMLLTLVELGFVARMNKHYQLTPRILRLGYSFLSQSGLDGLVRPFLAELTQKIGESSSVGVLDDVETVAVCHVTSTVRKTGLLLREGTRWPAYVMASGRMLLSGLPDDEVNARLRRMELKALTTRTLTRPEQILKAVQTAREQGYALIEGEVEDGMAAVSVPIRDRNNALVASLNTSSNMNRRSPAELRRAVVPELKATAAEIGRVLPDGVFAWGS
jgi:IclR family transcriptional regulator, pca regulon regulatory protein